MSKRLALIIANSEFSDPKLRRLIKPSLDAEVLAEVLGDPSIGNFEVTTLVNENLKVVRREIARLFDRKIKRDLLLIHYSGHGIRDRETGDLYLAVSDTETDLASATAIEAAYMSRQLDRSKSQRKVVVLDCCHSGAFESGSRAGLGSYAGVEEAFEASGYGRVILTASNAVEYAWEGDELLGEAAPSVFTHFLVEGLRTGQADSNEDGEITIDELYEYVHDKVVTSGQAKQTPQKWGRKVEGKIVIARNPNPVIEAVELPSELQESIKDTRPWVRAGAAQELARLLRGHDPALARAAYNELKRMEDDDSRRVSSEVIKILADQDKSDPIREETEVKEELLGTSSVEVERLVSERTEVKQLPAEEPGWKDSSTQIILQRWWRVGVVLLGVISFWIFPTFPMGSLLIGGVGIEHARNRRWSRTILYLSTAVVTTAVILIAEFDITTSVFTFALLWFGLVVASVISSIVDAVRNQAV